MSVNLEIVDDSVVSCEIKSEEFECYAIKLNDTDLNFARGSKIEFDSDGDVFVSFTMEDDTELLDHLSKEEIIEYLEGKGYTVTKDED